MMMGVIGYHLENHIDIVNQTDGMYACSVGDLSNNWARRGKLAGLWADQTTMANSNGS